MPLPLISASPPSALRSTIVQSAPSAPGRSVIRPSAPMPRWRSQSARATAAPAGPAPSRATTTRKSFPVPWSFETLHHGLHLARSAGSSGARIVGGAEPGDAGVAPEPHPLAAGERPGAARRSSRTPRRGRRGRSRCAQELLVADGLAGRPREAAPHPLDLVEQPAASASPRPRVDAAREHRAREPDAGDRHRERRRPEPVDAGTERRERLAGQPDHLERADDAARVVRVDPRCRRAGSSRRARRTRRRRRRASAVQASSSARSARSSPGKRRSSTTACTYRPVPPTSSARRPRASMSATAPPRRGLERGDRPVLRRRRRRRPGGAGPEPAPRRSAWRCRCRGPGTPASSRPRRSRRRRARRRRASASVDLPDAVGPTRARCVVVKPALTGIRTRAAEPSRSGTTSSPASQCGAACVTRTSTSAPAGAADRRRREVHELALAGAARSDAPGPSSTGPRRAPPRPARPGAWCRASACRSTTSVSRAMRSARRLAGHDVVVISAAGVPGRGEKTNVYAAS